MHSRAKLLRGDPVFGIALTAPSAQVLELSARAGFDFVAINAEHGPWESTVRDLLRTAEAAGIDAIVVTTATRKGPIQRALDAGAAGVELPNVNTADDARTAVQASRFPPAGGRERHVERWSGYVSGAGALASRAKKQNTLVVAHIEDIVAVRNLDQILEVPGIDVYLIGSWDLSQSMGMPGQFDSPEVRAAHDTVVRKVRAAGRVVGMLADSSNVAQRLQAGVQFVLVSWQPLVIGEGRRSLAELRSVSTGARR